MQTQTPNIVLKTKRLLGKNKNLLHDSPGFVKHDLETPAFAKNLPN